MSQMSNKEKKCIIFGDRVRQLRHHRGLSQESLAEKTGIHRTYIGGIERGERNPTLLMIHRLAEALNIEPGDLFQEGE